ncbi:hypothetical protein HUU39_26560 [candidate division KSB1 bacterium]|nr:hypothetical protein [candidate division KSB1 bacterium]
MERYHGRLYETVRSAREGELIVAAMQHAGGNQVRATQLLGSSRVMWHDRPERDGSKAEVIMQKA